MQDEKKALWAIDALVAKHNELGRTPQKTDFDEPTRARIKAFLGPWPRALEKAGLKEAKETTTAPVKRKKKASPQGGQAQ